MKKIKFYDEACSTQTIMVDEPIQYDYVQDLANKIAALKPEEAERFLLHLKAIKNEQTTKSDL